MIPLLALAALGAVAWALRGQGQAALLCEGGRLVPRVTSRFDLFAPRPVDDLPALPVPKDLCKDQRFRSPAALRERWTTLASDLVEAALARDDAKALEALLPVADALGRGPSRTSPLRRERGALLLALARADLDASRRHHLRARTRLIEARKAGADPKVLRTLESELAALCAADAKPRPKTRHDPAPAPPLRRAPLEIPQRDL